VFSSVASRRVRAINSSSVAALPAVDGAAETALASTGPQTAGELRIHSERWYRFADISSVEGFLEEMRDRSEEKGGPLVVQLPRAGGARETRWAHLLCGPVDLSAEAPPAAAAPETPMGLAARVALLEDEVIVLRAAVEDLRSQLGLSPPGHLDANDRA
jgi:uncharacterized protein YceH (UPF0502 family)